MKKLATKASLIYLMLILTLSFVPFSNLYFLANQKLQTINVYINESSISSFLSTITLNDTDLYYEDIKALRAKSISLNVFVFFNWVNISDINIDEALKKFVPTKIEDITAFYSIFYPTKIFLSSSGDFGSLDGSVDLIDKKIHIELLASKLMKTSFKSQLKMMKKTKNKKQIARYIYEYKY